jgi:hypothetical protein
MDGGVCNFNEAGKESDSRTGVGGCGHKLLIAFPVLMIWRRDWIVVDSEGAAQAIMKWDRAESDQGFIPRCDVIDYLVEGQCGV